MSSAISNYPSDLTDAEWEAVRRCIPPRRPIGVARRVSMRAVVNAIRYRRRSGCPWRLLPHDFPHWRTVYGYYRQWQSDGTWRRIEAAEREARVAAGDQRSGQRSQVIAPSSSGTRDNMADSCSL